MNYFYRFKIIRKKTTGGKFEGGRTRSLDVGRSGGVWRTRRANGSGGDEGREERGVKGASVGVGRGWMTRLLQRTCGREVAGKCGADINDGGWLIWSLQGYVRRWWQYEGYDKCVGRRKYGRGISRDEMTRDSKWCSTVQYRELKGGGERVGWESWVLPCVYGVRVV